MPHTTDQARPGASELHLLRMQQALRLRSAGKTYLTIALEMGISEPTARGLVKSAVDQIKDEVDIDAKAMFIQITERLEFALDAISKRVAEGDVYAVEKWIALNDKLAKLYGLYAPVESKAELTVTHKGLPGGPGTVGERIAGLIAKSQERQLEAPGNQVPITVDVVSVRELDPQ